MAPLVWLMSGCSTGLGLAIAQEALTAGHKVIATSRNPSTAREVVAGIEKNANAKWLPLNVAGHDLEKQFADCLQIFGRIDVLVNNAG